MTQATFREIFTGMGGTDRRRNSRFPIVQELRYRLLGGRGAPHWAAGKTLDISSNGILFEAEGPLPPGRRVELAVSWPAQLDGKCPMKLVARGKVVRCRGNDVAVEIDKYEFRTQGRAGLLPQNGA
jgi:hypothetical protein